MLVPGRTLLLLLVIFSAALVAAATGNIYTRSASIYSTSPENIFMTGSHDFYSLLSQKGYRVILGSPNYVATRYYMYGRTLYIVLGPDKPFTEDEASTLAKLVKDGRIALLVADETGNSNKLVEKITGIRISSDMLESSVTGRLSYIVPLICLGRVIVSTKVAWLENIPPSAKVVCWAEPSPGKRYPVAALVKTGKGVALIVSDSSIFSNFEIEGLRPFLSTRSVALSLVELVAKNYPVHYIVFDNTHYITGRVVEVSAFLRASISGVIDVLTSLSSWIKSRIHAILLAVIAAPLLASILVVGLPEKQREEHREIVNVDEVIETIRTIVEGRRSK